MIVFKIIQYGRARAVVNEFAALIKKCGVVFVGFDDKKRGLGGSTTQSGRNAKIQWHTTNQKAGVVACLLEYPGQH